MTDAYECEPSWGDAKDPRPQQCATELAARERLLLHARDLALVRRNSSASVGSRRSSSGSSTSSAATAASAKLEELRRPMESATTLTLPRNGGAGIVLFDPRDLDVRPSWKRKSFALELDTPEQDNDVDDDADDDEEEEDEESEDENNQRTPEERAERATTARLRRQAVEEICTTEQSYVRDLRTLHDYYIAVLEDRKHPIIEDAQIAVFFNNVRQLVMLNSKLLADLVAIMEKRKRMLAKRRYRRRQDSSSSQGDNQAAAQAESSETEGIGAMFCRYAPLFKLYGGYARDYEEVAGLVDGYKKDSRLRFTDFLAECKERSSSNKDFESLLILPIQRIPRYKMLLERVVKYTAPDHPDADALGRAVKSISDAASHINETVRDQENLASVLQAQSQFAGQLALFTPNRRLIKSGKLTKMSTKRPEEVMLHLFNDLLLYSGVLITGGYRIRRVVNLNSKAVGVKTQIPKSYQSLFAAGQLRADCGFVITSLEKTFILFAPTPDEQVKWVDAIKLAISDAQAKAENTTGETAADAAALWVPDEVVGSCTICHSAFTFYFRRHHCRRCGAVVCGNCSTHRSILFVVDSAREERVCNPCFRVLDLVKVIAFRWLSRLVEFRGVLRRNRANKWSEHYFELRRGVLMQYKLAQSDSEHKGRRARVCTDSLDLAGAIVIHRADTRSQKNRFCFQISTSEYDLEMLELVASPYKSEESTPVAASTPVLSTPANNNSGNNLIFKLSPLKQAVSRFGDAVASRGAPFDSTLSDDSNLSSSRTHAKSPTPTHAIATVATTSATSVNVNAADWILCATSYSDEMSWTDAIQRSADRALSRTRRSRVTESSIIPMMSFDSGRPQTAGNSVPTLTLSLGARPTDAELSMIMSGDDESSVVEHRRLQILKELIRSEESYVTCLGECICMYVQPLLLRQLEGQKLMRRRQQMKYKKSSLLHQLGRLGHGSSGGGSARNLFSGSPSPSPSSAAFSSSSSQRTVSTSSITSVKTRKFALSPGDYAAAAASLLTSSAASGSNLGGSASASGESSSGNTKRQQELLVMNADMAIFFSSVDQMCTLNQQLLEHLSRHVDELSTAKKTAKDSDENSEHRVYRVGAIFHAYAPLLQLYTAYASRHASALQAIDSPQFANFLKDLPQEASITRLWRYLNMPMERIPRYKMFLQELLEVTPPDHLDFAPLQAAIRSVDLVADKIQEISDRRDNARKLEEVGAKVGLDLRGRGRFVKDGLLRKVCRSKVQKYYFVLLEDAIVYGRHGGGLTKKRFKLIDLWECKVSNETESMPGVISAVANSNSAFCFYSPLKSFILLTDSAEEKAAWTTSIGECIARTLRGQTHPRRASVRSDLLLDDEERSHLYDLEATCSTLVIKNGWLNVSSDDNRKSRRLWITLTMQTLSLSSAFKAAQPEESFAIENCSASLVRPGTRFKVELTPEADAASASAKRTIVLEAQSLAEREEWVRALSHCIAGSHELPKTLDMRRRSVNQAMLAPIFMFDKVSNVCTICTQTFAVYRPRHHCRLCGSLVCGNCSRKRWTLAYGSSKKASRICDSCATANLTTSSSLASPPHA